jgi:acylphosphatase
MALKKTDIVFNIDDDGNITITVEGVKGQDCTKITQELEEAFGIVTDREFTSEYYQQAETDRLTIKLDNE